MIGTARPKTYLMYQIATFSKDATCYINCYPQQKWEYSFTARGDKVRLERNNVTLIIPTDDFMKHWKTKQIGE